MLRSSKYMLYHSSWIFLWVPNVVWPPSQARPHTERPAVIKYTHQSVGGDSSEDPSSSLHTVVCTHSRAFLPLATAYITVCLPFCGWEPRFLCKGYSRKNRRLVIIALAVQSIPICSASLIPQYTRAQVINGQNGMLPYFNGNYVSRVRLMDCHVAITVKRNSTCGARSHMVLNFKDPAPGLAYFLTMLEASMSIIQDFF